MHQDVVVDVAHVSNAANAGRRPGARAPLGNDRKGSSRHSEAELIKGARRIAACHACGQAAAGQAFARQSLANTGRPNHSGTFNSHRITTMKHHAPDECNLFGHAIGPALKLQQAISNRGHRGRTMRARGLQEAPAFGIHLPRHCWAANSRTAPPSRGREWRWHCRAGNANIHGRGRK